MEIRFKTLIVIVGSLALLNCGKKFQTVSTFPTDAVVLEKEEQGQSQSQASGDNLNEKPNSYQEWIKEIPNKYDDVGDFYRVKNQPEISDLDRWSKLAENELPGSSKETDRLAVVRGRLQLSRVTHEIDKLNSELIVKGDVMFSDQKPQAFEMRGLIHNTEIALSIADEKSALYESFKAKALCELSEQERSEKGAQDKSLFNCDNMVINFYYRNKNIFYTDQLLSKNLLKNENKDSDIKENTDHVSNVPDVFFDSLPGEDVNDYVRDIKSGNIEEDSPDSQEGTLPVLFAEPSIEDVATLYPDAKNKVEEIKKKTTPVFVKLKPLPLVPIEFSGNPKDPGPVPVFVDKSDPNSRDKSASNNDRSVKTDQDSKPKSRFPFFPFFGPKKNQDGAGVSKKEDSGKEKSDLSKAPKSDKKLEQVAPVVPGKEPQSPAFQSSSMLNNRPRNQSWGAPNTGMIVNNKRVYLTNSTDLLDVWKKLGSNQGFTLMSPQNPYRFGTYDLVELIVNLGEWVRLNSSGVELVVGNLSRKEGGPLGNWVNRNGRSVWSGHKSHRTGMDADIAYLTKNPKMVFNNMDRPNKDGYTHSDFMAAEQWNLMKAAFQMAPIQVIYVNRNIKNEMCKQALKLGDLKTKMDISSEAAKILNKIIVIDSHHGNHWHIRLDCAVLKEMKLQSNCQSIPQPYRGTECQNVRL